MVTQTAHATPSQELRRNYDEVERVKGEILSLRKKLKMLKAEQVCLKLCFSLLAFCQNYKI